MKQKKTIATILSVLFVCAIWQLIALWVNLPAIFPSLFDLIGQIIFLFTKVDFYIALSNTILRGLIGFIIAFFLAFGWAVMANYSTFWKAFFQPFIVITRSVPVISFVLIALLWLSPPQLPVFIALITMFPVLYQNILTGLEHTDTKWVEMARVFGKSPIQRFWQIYIPSSKSIMFDGISTAMGFGWRAVIIGEVLAQPIHGIGTAMKQAQAFINVSELMAWTIIAVCISYLFEYIVKYIRNFHFQKLDFRPKVYPHVNSNRNTDNKIITIENLCKDLSGRLVFNHFSSTFNSEKICLLKGVSGKGKTTLLRLITGLEKPDSGRIDFEEQYRFGVSFQDVRLLPWLSVYENISFAIAKPTGRHETDHLITYLLDKMELSDQAHKYPRELSGGQQQRVGLARALAVRPDILLLDEPMNGLDKELRMRITQFLEEWIETYKPLVIWATHETVAISNFTVVEI